MNEEGQNNESSSENVENHQIMKNKTTKSDISSNLDEYMLFINNIVDNVTLSLIIDIFSNMIQDMESRQLNLVRLHTNAVDQYEFMKTFTMTKKIEMLHLQNEDLLLNIKLEKFKNFFSSLTNKVNKSQLGGKNIG